ncbi:MAG: 4Fe-4S binding protein [Acetanaerobacterium sp.]
MAAGWLSGENLYQAKEPAFSREQRQFLRPKVLYLPDYDEQNSAPSKAATADAVLLGRYELDYPRLDCTTFLRFSLKARADDDTAGAAGRLFEDRGGRPKIKRERHPFSKVKESLDVGQYELEELIEIAEKACIVDETDGKYLSDKLTGLYEAGYDALVCDAIDEQPYVSSNINTLLQNSEEVMRSLKMTAQACGIKTCFALCYADIDDAETVVPHKMYEIPIKRIFGRYPVRSRVKKTLAKCGRSYIIGAQALLHLARAAKDGRVHNTTIVTVAGDCVGNPCNLEVRVGATAREVLEFCGLIKNPARVVMGGSMRGVAIVDLDLPVLYTTRALLAFSRPIQNPVLDCILCGRCVESCPRKLAPNYLYKCFQASDQDALVKLRADKCIECGVCSYVCPANLELTHSIKKAKKLVKGVLE